MPCVKFGNAMVCSSGVYQLKVGKRKVIAFTYHPYLGVEFLDARGRVIKTRVPKRWWRAWREWMGRNTYQRAVRGDREMIGYVKKNWKP